MSFQVRRLEAQGLTPKQAEAITAVITEVLNDSLENVAQSFTSKTEMTRVCLQVFPCNRTLNKFIVVTLELEVMTEDFVF